MATRELRPLVLKIVRDGTCGQVLELVQRVEKLALQTGKAPQGLDDDDRVRVLDIVWELVSAHALAPGANAYQPELPWFHVTEHGRRCLEHDAYLPYDPDGYLDKLSQRVPQLDDTVRLYVAESLQAYLNNLPLSSAVMLGAASEQVFLLVSAGLSDALPTADARNKYQQATAGKPTKRHFDEFMKRLATMRADLPRELDERLDEDWNGISSLIRNARNDAGHPARPNVDMDGAMAGLLLFPGYCERASCLATFLRDRAAASPPGQSAAAER